MYISIRLRFRTPWLFSGLLLSWFKIRDISGQCPNTGVHLIINCLLTIVFPYWLGLACLTWLGDFIKFLQDVGYSSLVRSTTGETRLTLSILFSNKEQVNHNQVIWIHGSVFLGPSFPRYHAEDIQIHKGSCGTEYLVNEINCSCWCNTKTLLQSLVD